MTRFLTFARLPGVVDILFFVCSCFFLPSVPLIPAHFSLLFLPYNSKKDFDERYAPSVDETYTANVSLPSQSQKRFQADILDTEGQDEFYIFRQDHAVGFDCYVLVYSVESRRSFDIVQVINEKLLNALGTESHPRVLVACKQDLPLPLHRVSQREGAELAKVWGCPFRECSAKTSQGVSEVFQSAIQEVSQVLLA